jgi:hypothetical protein
VLGKVQVLPERSEMGEVVIVHNALGYFYPVVFTQ